MSPGEEKKKNNLNGWAAIIAATLSGIAALVTAVGFPHLFSSVTQADDAAEQLTDTLLQVKFNVFTKEYQPLEQVEVRFVFDGAPAPRATDSNGYVSIKVPNRKDIEVLLSKEGFETKRQILNLEADPDKTITIYLEEVVNSFGPLTRDYFIGRWQAQQEFGQTSSGTVIDYYDDGSFNGEGFVFDNGQGVKVPVSGRWDVEILSDEQFRLRLDYDNENPTWEAQFKVIDENNIRNIDQNYRAVRVE